MTRRAKILIFTVIWMGLLAYLTFGQRYSAAQADEVVCSAVRINIADSARYRFVTPQLIRRMLTESGQMPIGMPIHRIDTHGLEEQVGRMVAVRSVQAYTTLNGELHIDIRQRQPMVRVFNANGQSYYIDDAGLIMPPLTSFTAHVLVVSGNIREPFSPKANVNVMQWNDSLQHGQRPMICQLMELVHHIAGSEFWSAQVGQIYVDGPHDVRLVPTVGPHTVLLGGLDGFEGKLRKLRAFYSKALPHEGWNAYKAINLKYSNQIICTTR